MINIAALKGRNMHTTYGQKIPLPVVRDAGCPLKYRQCSVRNMRLSLFSTELKSLTGFPNLVIKFVKLKVICH
ncbi:MAG: hypothetical protein LBQ28_00105 [Prevotellaceae bacterium]|jgi:hypothetical protein|nr:hypothetical protein [Prevotellaceae bacterium]